MPPVVGITPDLVEGELRLRRGYADLVAEAGGVPILLPPLPESLEACLALCDAVILTGGDDPAMERWGVATHPRAKPIDPDRQQWELAILEALDDRELPALGICLGMQLMALVAGGALDQHLPETTATWSDHWGRVEHPVSGTLGEGVVLSHHRQAVTDPGRLDVVARSHDGLIEAIRCPRRRFHVGVQWHPERTAAARFGSEIFRALVDAAG